MLLGENSKLEIISFKGERRIYLKVLPDPMIDPEIQ